jgi:hypothetical protein
MAKELIIKAGNDNDLNDNRTTGFVSIIDIGDAQQVKVSTNKLARVVQFLQAMQKMGFEETYITVQKGKPVILGAKTMGIGLAQIEEVEG